MTECGHLAQELKVSPGTVSKWAKKAIDAGWLRKKGRGYETIEGAGDGNEDLWFGTLRFHGELGSFPPRFHVYRGKGGFRFRLVSGVFPFVSRFLPYMWETRDEGDFSTRG